MHGDSNPANCSADQLGCGWEVVLAMGCTVIVMHRRMFIYIHMNHYGNIQGRCTNDFTAHG